MFPLRSFRIRPCAGNRFFLKLPFIFSDTLNMSDSKRKRRRFSFMRSAPPDVNITSLMRAAPSSTSVPGDRNTFTSIEAQNTAVSRRYEGIEPLGGPLTRAIIDTRVGFIVSDGLSITSEDQATREWAEGFLEENRFLTGALSALVRDGETYGMAVIRLFKGTDGIYAIPVSQKVLSQIEVDFREFSGWTSSIPNGFSYRSKSGTKINVPSQEAVIVLPNGSLGTPTRTGSIVSLIDNYDRCLYDLRRNNHVSARATPTFRVSNSADVPQLRRRLAESGWKIGQAYVGQAEFSYVSPEISATENLIQEARILIETIAGTTGVPVHWLGHVEVMNNRSTADTLYETIKNATAADRAAWSSGIKELLQKARTLYVDSGLGVLDLSATLDVSLPLVSFSEFRDRVAALSMAYGDEAISISDYRNLLPGIDPLTTAEAIKSDMDRSFSRIKRSEIIGENEE